MCVCVLVCVCALAGMLAGHVECVKVLIEHGANVNASNSTGYVPLHVAVHNHHLLCIQGASVSVRVSMSVPLFLCRCLVFRWRRIPLSSCAWDWAWGCLWVQLGSYQLPLSSFVSRVSGRP